MDLQYGTNFSASQIARILEKREKQQTGIRTWSQLLGGASLGFGAQTGAITADYGEAMRQAYEQNFKQQDAISAAGLSQGYTDQALALNRRELAQTYDTYIRNYGQDIAKATENYGAEVGAIAGDLSARAENFEKLFSSAYDYLSGELYGSMSGKKDYLTEYGLDWLRATNTDGTTRLKSWEELTKELFDENGELTEQGVRFYDQMFNTNAGMVADYTSTKGERIRGFDEWLAATDADLREWWLSADEYNYTLEGRNRGTANVLSGRESTDYDPSIPDQTVLNASRNLSDFKAKVEEYSTENFADRKIELPASARYRSNKAEATYKDFLEVGKNTEKPYDTRANALNKIIEPYKTETKTEYDMFKKELNSLLDSNLAGEFWSEYGKNVDKIYEEIQNLGVEERGLFKEFFRNYSDKGEAARKQQDIRLEETAKFISKEWEESGFSKAMNQLYKDLEKFINTKKREALRTVEGKPSGF